MTSSFENAGLVALIAIVPLVVLMLTSFVKVSVVLSLLRNAIGATDAPSGLVVMGLSLILTFFVMAPVAVQMVTAAATKPAPEGVKGTAPAGTAPAPTSPASTAPAPTSPASTAPASTAPASTAPASTALAPSASTPHSTVPTTAAADTTAPAGTASTAGTATAPAGTVTSGAAQSASASTAQTGPTAGTSATTGPSVDVLATMRSLVPADRRDDIDAVARAIVPLKAFLAKHASQRDKDTFVDLGGTLGQPRSKDELAVLAPAFVTTELREAFAIAVLIFIPFLVIDLLVGLGLAALGLASTSPQTVALPIKLLLFVAVDGWRLLIDSLLRGYA